MDRRVWIGGGIVAAALAFVGVRMAGNSGAKTGLDEALRHLPPGFTAQHGEVTFNAVTGEAKVHDLVVSKDGVQLLTAKDLAVSGIGAMDESGTPKRIDSVVMHDASVGPYQHIDRIDLTGLAPATLRAVLDPAAYPGGKPAWTDKRPVLEHGEVHGVDGAQMVNPPNGPAMSTKFTIGMISEDGVSLSQLAAAPDYKGNPAVLVFAIEQSMAERSGAVKDVVFTVSGPNAVQGRIGRGSNGAYDGGRLKSMSLDDVKITTSKPVGTVTIEGMSAQGFDMSKLLGMAPAVAAEPDKPHPELMNAMHVDSGEMHGLSADYADGPLVTLASMAATAGPAGGDGATGTFTMRALTVKTSGRPLKADDRAALQSFGMEDFTTDVDEAGGFDPATGVLALKKLDVTLHDLGVLHVTLKISNIPPGGATTQAEMMAAAQAARLVGASVVWNDASLTSRLLKMTAAKEGVPEEQVVAGLAMPLASLPILLPGQPDAADQVNAFLSGRHSLGITISPASPVGMAEFNSTPPMGKATLLGVHISGS